MSELIASSPSRSRLVDVALARRAATAHRAESSLLTFEYEDAQHAYRSLLDDGTTADQLSVPGDFSDAGVAMSLMLALRDRDLPVPTRAAHVLLDRPLGQQPAGPARGLAAS